MACDAQRPILIEVENKAINSDSNDSANILIEGDNFHALTVLAKTHQNKIDLIYIDQPYNTGKTNDFMYNDKFVGEAYRHSKQLSFMHRRLESKKHRYRLSVC